MLKQRVFGGLVGRLELELGFIYPPPVCRLHPCALCSQTGHVMHAQLSLGLLRSFSADPPCSCPSIDRKQGEIGPGILAELSCCLVLFSFESQRKGIFRFCGSYALVLVPIFKRKQVLTHFYLPRYIPSSYRVPLKKLSPNQLSSHTSLRSNSADLSLHHMKNSRTNPEPTRLYMRPTIICKRICMWMWTRTRTARQRRTGRRI